MKQKKQLLMVLAMLTVTLSWAQKTIVTEGWDEATSKEVWSYKAVTWSIDWVTLYSDDTVERTPFTMSAPRELRTLTEWNLPYMAFGWEDYPLEFSDPQVSIVSSTNESRTSNGAVFSWVNEKREITDRMTIHSWFDNEEVTSFLKEVLDKNRNWENKWEALDPFNCRVSYKNHDYLFGQKYPKTVEVTRKESVTNYRWSPNGNKDEPPFRSDVLIYKVGDYTQEVSAIIRSERVGEYETFFPARWGWLYDVKQTVTKGRENGYGYIWSLHFAQGILPVSISSGSSPDWHFEYFENGASPLCNSGVYHDGTQVNAIASDDVDMMRWREAGPIMDSQDFDEAKQMNWNDGHEVSAITNRFDCKQENTLLKITDTYENKIISLQSVTAFKDEWGELVDVKQSLTKSDVGNSYVYVLSLHFSMGYVLPVIIPSTSIGPRWDFDLCENTPNATYNSAYYDKAEHVWKNAIAYDYGSKMYWAREGAILASKSYDVAANQQYVWDDGHGTSVNTNRYDIQMQSSGRISVTDTYTGTYLGSWDGGVSRSTYDAEYCDNTRTPQTFSAYLKVGKYGKVVWNSQEISNADTKEYSNGKQLTSEECKLPTWQFQIIPDEGFEVDSVGLNNLNVTSYVADNVLTLRTIPRDIHLEFRFVKKDYVPIVFADPKTEAICLANWDIDGNGVLDRGEAAIVESLGGVFRASEITSFEELPYFTSLTSIEKAFSGCKSLLKVTIPQTITSIGASAFYNCSSLASITIPDGVTNIEQNAFSGCSGLTSITISTNLTEIGRYAFYKCSNLKSVELPEGLTTIGELAFENCTSLTSVTIPSSVSTIVNGTFRNCGLTSVTILDGVETIEGYSFNKCSSLASLTIHGATKLKGHSFDGCTAIASVTSYAKEPESFFSSEVFPSETYTNATLYIPKGETSTYKNTPGWSSFVNIVEKEDSPEPSELNVGDTFESIIDGATCQFEVTDGHNVTLRSSMQTGNVTIPPTVTYGGVEYTITAIEGAETGLSSRPNSTVFVDKTGITGVVIPNTVTRIGACAFDGCENIASVTIGSNVQSIGFKAFNGCKSLSSVTWGTGLKTIGERAFDNTQLATVTIPDGVEEIERAAFRSEALTDVTLPTSIKKLSYDAFSCASKREINVHISDLTAFSNIEVLTNEYGYGLCFDPYHLILNGTEVTDLTIPSCITKVGHIYAGCASIQSLTLHKDVTEIAACAFIVCENITKVVSQSETPVNISATMRFDDEIKQAATLYVPSGRTAAYKSAGWNFTNIVEMSALNDGDTFEATVGETTFKVKVLSTADKTCQIGADKTGANGSMMGSDAIVSGSRNWDGVIPSKVTGSDGQEYTVIGIGNRAFKEYGSITTVILPNTLQYISSGAFMRMEDLMYVTIPAGLKTVGGLLFNGQEILTEVVSLIEDPEAINSISIDCGGQYGNNATLVVPAGTKSIYQNADGWNHFPRIVEIKACDANGDGTVDLQDVEIVREFIMTGRIPEGFVRHNADRNGDKKINVADIVNIVNEIPTE